MFAQESVMDVEKEREAFEATSPFSIYINKVNSDGNKYTPIYYKDLDYAQIMSFGWLAWQAAKTQAVLDVQQALNDRLLVRSIKEQVESHIAEISVNDLFDKGWFAAMKCIQSNIDMLEAREPAND